MFIQVPQPLAYAEALLEQFARLARASDDAALLGGLVLGLAELSGCELTQLYLLDATHTTLGMTAECLDGSLQPREAQSLPADYKGEQLLQFALCQNRVVCLDDLPGSLHEISFLPSRTMPWQSLLCVPIVSDRQTGGRLAGLREQSTSRAAGLCRFPWPTGHVRAESASPAATLETARR